jgi:hypothetical protein
MTFQDRAFFGIIGLALFLREHNSAQSQPGKTGNINAIPHAYARIDHNHFTTENTEYADGRFD